MSEPVGERSWDPIALEIMWQRLLSCADQAAATLLRTSFSTVVAASHDFRYAITDSMATRSPSRITARSCS